MVLDHQSHEGTQVKPVVCVACSQQCGVLVRVENGRVVEITSDKEHPVSEGFICVKGTGAAEFHYRPDRIHWPLKRVGARGEDRWERIEWEQAIDEIAGQMRKLSDKYGPPYLYGVLETSINACIDNDPGACDPVMGAWPLRAIPCRIAPLPEPLHQAASP